VRCVVLDEADRMADMGFMPAVRRLLDRTARDRQTVLFSATLDGDVAKLTREYQRDPVRHEVGEETPDVQSATHLFWKVDRVGRNDVVADVVKAAWPSIIFTRTRHGADRLAKQLGKLDVESVAIHGGLSQGQRTRALESFSNGRVHAMIATDVAARGIHVDGVASVVHYDLPEDHKAYVHRSGRTARAGAAGMVVSMIQPEQTKDARKMQREIGLDAEITAPDMALLPTKGLDADRRLAPVKVHRAHPERHAAPAARPDRQRGDRDRDRRPGSDARGSRDAGTPPERERGADSRNDWYPRTEQPRRSQPNRSSASPARKSGGASRANRAARRSHLQPGR
jgi:superfamily II DNA/RNA helicase